MVAFEMYKDSSQIPVLIVEEEGKLVKCISHTLTMKEPKKASEWGKLIRRNE